MWCRWPPAGSGGQRWHTPYLFAIPALILFGVFFAWPVVTAIQLSFLEYDVVSPPVFVGVDTFVRLVGDGRFWTALLDSVLFLAGMFPLLVVVPFEHHEMGDEVRWGSCSGR